VAFLIFLADEANSLVTHASILVLNWLSRSPATPDYEPSP
jgi:hypothetical protein